MLAIPPTTHPVANQASEYSLIFPLTKPEIIPANITIEHASSGNNPVLNDPLYLISYIDSQVVLPI